MMKVIFAVNLVLLPLLVMGLEVDFFTHDTFLISFNAYLLFTNMLPNLQEDRKVSDGRLCYVHGQCQVRLAEKNFPCFLK